MLQQHGANLAAVDDSGLNCLHMAANQGHGAVVDWLLVAGLGVDTYSNNHTTPLMYACGGGHLNIAKTLLQRGANLAAVEDVGNSCLHMAADSGHEAVLDWLLEAGLGVDTYSNNHMTPLMYACHGGHPGAAQMLLQQGAKLNATDIGGRSALHIAVDEGHIKVVTWLLDQNVQVDVGGEMTTPLSMAFEKLNWEMMVLLIERGANLYRQNRHGERIGDDIFTQAKNHDRYDVLLQLISRDWPFPEGWDTVPTSDSSDDSSDGSLDDVVVAAMRTKIALIHDLDRVFRVMAAPLDTATEDNFIDPAWLLPAKRSDRQQFIESYLNHFLVADEETSDQPISNFEISSHPLFSYVIHDELTHHPRNFTTLLDALGGTGRVIPASYPQKVLLFNLHAIQLAWQRNRPFQDAHLSPATLSVIGNVLKRQLETVLLATEAYCLKDLAQFPDTLKVLCKKYIRFGGDFDAAGFSKALTKQGIYAVNADRMAELVKNVWKDVRLKPLDLPPMATIGRVYGLSESQVMERLFTQINKAVLEDSEDWILPGFATGMATLQQEDQDIYVDQIFGQWRQMWAALGVVPPEVVMSQQ
jgi:ankyrin repeat protein